MTRNLHLVELVHAAAGSAEVRYVDISAEAITEILLRWGAPPGSAPAIANEIVEYLIKLHQAAGATRVQ